MGFFDDEETRLLEELAGDIASARGGLLPFAERLMKFESKYLAVARYSMTTVFFIRKDIMEAKGLKPPKVYDPDVIEFARKTQDASKDLWGFGQTLNRSDDGDGFMQNILWDYGGAVWDKDGKPAYKLSVNDFVIKALALALQRVPDANVSWTEGGMLKHRHSDIGVAVALPGGLITPIVRGAESKSLSAISNEMRDLAARARARKLKPQEYQGGTSSVSNLGMYGIKDFTAVINPPQSTILAVGAAEERAVARHGKIEAAHIMSVTLSCDHRSVDGALGAELIGAFKTLIENPVMMVV
jgi:hypothetical protein